MSKLLESTDFGPQGFRWLTLKRISVRKFKFGCIHYYLKAVFFLHTCMPSAHSMHDEVQTCGLQYQDPNGRYEGKVSACCLHGSIRELFTCP